MQQSGHWPVFISFFFPSKKGNPASGAQLLGEFTATNNNQEINIKFESKLLVKSKMSSQPINYAEIEQTAQAQKQQGGRGGGPHTNLTFTGFKKTSPSFAE